MSRDAKIVFSVLSGWLSRGVTIALNLLLVPVLFGNLEPQELGLWLFLGQTAAILSVLDLGISFTLARRVAFSHSKVTFETESEIREKAQKELNDLIASSARIYFILAICVFFITTSIGSLYFRTLNLSTNDFYNTCIGWTVLCLNNAFVLLSARWTSILQGSGYVGWDALISSLVSVLTLLSQVCLVLQGGGLIGLAIAVALGSMLQRFLLIKFAKLKRPELFSTVGAWNSSIAASFVAPSLKAWVTGFCVAVSVHTDQFFVLSEGGAESFPNYRAAYLIFMNLALISCAVASASSAFISHAWQAGRFDEVQKLLLRNCKLSLFTMGIGSATVFALGDSLFNFWLGKNHFIGYPILCVFFLSLFLETQAQVISLASRATEDEVYMMTSILSACLKIGLAIILPLFLGLLGIALATMLAQLLTNHWFMVVRGLNRCRISKREYAARVILPVATVVFSTLLIERSILDMVCGSSDVFRTITAFTISLFVWTSAVWLLAIGEVERGQFSTFVSSRVAQNLAFLRMWR